MKLNSVRAVVGCGFPEGIKDRELKNFAWLLPDYLDCWIRYKNKTPVAFIRFDSCTAADAAIAKLNDYEFETGHYLRCALASRDPRFGEFVEMQDIPKKLFPGLNRLPMPTPGFDYTERPRNNNKLFICGISSSVGESDIKKELAKQTGFANLRISRREGQILAFADFLDHETAANALATYRHGFTIAKANVRAVVTFAHDDGPAQKRRRMVF